MGFARTARLVAAPGLEGAPEKLAHFDNLGLEGAAFTGPPNFRFMVAHLSGSRDEKLQKVSYSQ